MDVLKNEVVSLVVTHIEPIDIHVTSIYL